MTGHDDSTINTVVVIIIKKLQAGKLGLTYKIINCIGNIIIIIIITTELD